MSALSSQVDELEQIRNMVELCPETVAELGRLVAELESIYVTMSGTSDEWKSNFYEQWTSLEEVFAVSLDRGQVTLTAEGKTIVVEALYALRVLIEKLQTSDADLPIQH